ARGCRKLGVLSDRQRLPPGVRACQYLPIVVLVRGQLKSAAVALSMAILSMYPVGIGQAAYLLLANTFYGQLELGDLRRRAQVVVDAEIFQGDFRGAFKASA